MVVPVHRAKDLAAILSGMNAWAAHMHGKQIDFSTVDYRVPVCLVVGGEDHGVSAPVLAACKGTIWIPMAGAWDCLNVAASTAVLLAEVSRQRRTGPGASPVTAASEASPVPRGSGPAC